MDDKKTLEESILAELEKTGYPTEILTAALLEQHGWGTIHNPSYLDDTENISREFDVRAYQNIAREADSKTFSLGIYLIIECKKSDKPWVFFTTPAKVAISRRRNLGKLLVSPYDHQRRILWSEYADKTPIVSDDAWRSFHHYFQQERWGRTYYEPFKKQERGERSPLIYTAVSSATKAALFHLKDFTVRGSWIPIYYPIIVFDGEIFDAQVHGKGATSLLPSNHIVLNHHYMTPNRGSSRRQAESHELLIDVVRESYLDEFLTLIQREHQILADMFTAPLAQGRLDKPHQ